MSTSTLTVRRTLWQTLGLVSLLLLALFTYIYGLDSAHIPKNGDEYVYQHITRLTAESGHWLPLESELDRMRNTKPPLLFWQGIASTQHGSAWTLWNLRWPSVLYCFVTALLCFLLAQKLGRQWQTGAVAALAFLGFFATYRFGRPFLTNPAEMFWLFLPCFALIYWRETWLARGFTATIAMPLTMALVIGIGLLYKSYALLAPVGLAVAWMTWHSRDYRMGEFISRDVLRLTLLGLGALGIFALWFVFDPDPNAVWQEFVVGENIGKFDLKGESYWQKLLWGGSSAWSLALGFPQNAGLLALPVFGLAASALSARNSQSRDANTGRALLWIWVATFFIVFALPSQRSSRYLLAAMPAIAILLALAWNHIHRGWFWVTTLAAAALLALMAALAVELERALGQTLYGPGLPAMLLLGLMVAIAGLWRPNLTRGATLALAFITLIAFTALIRPLDGALGTYDATAQTRVGTRTVGVPYDFNAKYERYRFLLPHAGIAGYRTDAKLTTTELTMKFPLFALQGRLDAPPCGGCKVIATRLDLRTRDVRINRESYSIRGLIDAMVVREYLVEAP